MVGYKQELKRTLSVRDLLVYGLVSMTPIAPVSVFGIVFNASHGMVPLVYVLGAVAMTFTAFSYMSMSREFPLAGSVYTYATRSLAPAIGFLAGWAILLDYLLLPTAIYVSCAIAAHAAMPFIPRELCIVATLVGATFLNYRGIDTTARASFILLAVQIAIILGFVFLGMRGLTSHVAGASPSLAPLYNPAEISPRAVFGAFSIGALTFLGFDAISTLSEESKGGGAAVAKATILSLLICAILFIAQTWLASLFLLGETSLPAGEATTAAFYNIAELLGGAHFKFIVAVPGILLSGFAGAVAQQAATARLLYGMARDGRLPRALAYIDSERKTPVVALMLVAAMTLAGALLLVDRFELLISMVSFGALVSFLFLHASVIAYFNWRQKSRRWVRHLISPAIGLLAIGYVLLNAETNTKRAGFAWLSVGALVLLAAKVRERIIGQAGAGPHA